MDRRKIIAVAVALPALLGSSVGVSAHGPVSVADSGANSTQTQTLADGRVITTFRKGGVEVRSIGNGPLSAMNINEVNLSSDTKGHHGTLALGDPGTTLSKTALASKMSPSGAPASAVDDLIALGVDPAIAKRDFGDWETTPAAVSSGVALAAFRVPARVTSVVPAASSTVPWSTRCSSWNGVAGGKIFGNACTSVYQISANGGDWWLQSKFKATAWSTDTSLLPVRLKKLDGKIAWVAGNQVTDWDPSTTINRNACGQVTFGIALVGSVSVSVDLCPSKIVPFSISSTSSGAQWVGNETDTDPEGTAGWQEAHSPASAPATYTTGYNVTW